MRRIPLDTTYGPRISVGTQHAVPAASVPGTAVQWNAPAWVVVATDYQADSTAQRRLDSFGLDARQFLVRRHCPATRVRPAAYIIEPAFPGYLIVRAAPHEAHWLRKDYKHGIQGPLTAVGDASRPAILPDIAMAALIAMGQTHLHISSGGSFLGEIASDGTLRRVPAEEPPPPDYTGATLEVVDPDHPFAGLAGECMRSGRDRVVLLLKLIGSERRVTVARSAVRRA